MASIKKIYNTSGEGVEQLESSYTAGGNMNIFRAIFCPVWSLLMFHIYLVH